MNNWVSTLDHCLEVAQYAFEVQAYPVASDMSERAFDIARGLRLRCCNFIPGVGLCGVLDAHCYINCNKLVSRLEHWLELAL